MHAPPSTCPFPDICRFVQSTEIERQYKIVNRNQGKHVNISHPSPQAEPHSGGISTSLTPAPAVEEPPEVCFFCCSHSLLSGAAGFGRQKGEENEGT
jgi:hypothetical protein